MWQNHMKQKFKNLEREQVNKQLYWLYAHQDQLIRPKEGWIKTFRKAIGMTAFQLSKRLKVVVSHVIRIEQDEINDKTTLRTMKSAAEAMGCRLEYCFIPINPIETFLRERASIIASSKIEYVSHQMDLEKQGLSEKEKKAQLEQLIEELLKNHKKLWD